MIQNTLPHHLRLGEAVTLHCIPTDRFKTARLTVYTVAPADLRSSPLSTLMYGVLRRGSEAYPRLALLNRRLDELYGTTLTIRNYLHGDSQVISLTAEMLEDEFLPAADRGRMDILGGAMDLLAQILLHPLTDEPGLLRADAVEKEKQALCDSIRADRNDTRSYSGNRLRSLMCEGEPYGLSLSGSVEMIEGVTAAEVTEHWRQFVSRARCEVFYVGRASEDTVRRHWARAFEGWDPAPVALSPTVLHKASAEVRRVDEDMPVAQGKLCMGWAGGFTPHTPMSGREYAALLVFNELFGVMQTSRLFRRVRVEMGLCYYCESALDMTKGILWVSCGIRPDRRAEAEAAIAAELCAVQAGEVSEADVACAKSSLENTYRQISDSPCSMEAFWFGRTMDGLTDTPEEVAEHIRAVTAADVVAAARRFVPDTVYFLNGTRPDAPDGEEDYDDE